MASLEKKKRHRRTKLEMQLQRQASISNERTEKTTTTTTKVGRPPKVKPQEGAVSSSTHTATVNKSVKSNFKRECIVCKRKVHQDTLNEHYIDHFEMSPKCVTCDKVSKNPTNYVTHLLSHLPSQFFCVQCKKWFRQPIVFRRHRQTCEDGGVEPDNDDGIAKKSAAKLPAKTETTEVADLVQPRRGRPPKIKETDTDLSVKKVIKKNMRFLISYDSIKIKMK